MIMSVEDVIPLDISVEDAMKFVVSGGVLPPVEEHVRPASGAQFNLANTIHEQVKQRRKTHMIDKETLEAERAMLAKKAGESQEAPAETVNDSVDD